MFYGWTSREKMLLGINMVLLVALGGLFFYQSLGSKSAVTPFEPYPEFTQDAGAQQNAFARSSPSSNASSNDALTTAPQTAAENTLVVDVKGAVRSPGVYTLTTGDRVIDAIERAGGLLSEATTVPINLAQPLTDGMVIYVPTEEEVSQGGSSALVKWISGSMPSADSGKININQANAEELQALPGIGPARAEAIVRYREEHGPFTTLDELTNVPGIGQKILENIKDHIEL